MRFLYFGTRDRMVQMLPPDVGYDNAAVGWSDKMQFLNGGIAVRRSTGTHKEYVFTWSMKRRADVRPMLDYYSGIYGPGPFYFIDPFEADQNVAPVQWSAPAQGAFDAPVLVGNTPPTVAPSAANNLGYPAYAATYGTGVKRKLYIPIPPAHTAWVGVHGPASTGKVQVQGAISATNLAAPVAITNLSVTDPVRVNTSFSGNIFAGIEISLQDNTTYTGMMVQILPDGQVPAEGEFISGQGHSGCEFLEAPEQSPYSAALDRVGMTASLGEVVDWL